MKLILAIVRWFAPHLYTDMAWTYDLIAWLVSLGLWGTWQATGLEVLDGGAVLEVGHGPGHLLRQMTARGWCAVGADPSRQMGRLAARRLRRHGMMPRLVRARAQSLPFPAGYFGGVLSTFPSEYIFDPRSLAEAWRILKPGGQFVVVPVAMITGGSAIDRIGAWLNKVTGQAGEPEAAWSRPFKALGFQTRVDRLHLGRSVVLRLVAQKPGTAAGLASHGLET
jgi:ubiquinone/menaquinone biosynthesis C-methylase UbiE